MFMTITTGLLTGIAFGLLLYKVGATRYSRVMGMLTLQDTKIMKFAFTTIAVGCLIYGIAALAGVTVLETRIMPYLGGAHILGGIMFGTGLGVTGLCPGTCAAKAGGHSGNKRFSAPVAIIGLVVGVIAYAYAKQPLIDAGVIASTPRMLTLHGYLGLPYGVVAVVFGAAVLAIVLIVDRFTPEMHYTPAQEKKSALDWFRGEWSFLAGGTLAGILIVLSTYQGSYLGFSGSLLALVGAGAHAIGIDFAMVPKLTDGIIWRGALLIGALLGGFVATFFSTYTASFEGAKKKVTVDPKYLAKTFTGTTVMAMGAMIGGGCTTGAFLSAWPTLSFGSFAMAITFFATSMGVSQLQIFLKTLDMKNAQQVGERVYD